jgi:hypothetical protein
VNRPSTHATQHLIADSLQDWLSAARDWDIAFKGSEGGTADPIGITQPNTESSNYSHNCRLSNLEPKVSQLSGRYGSKATVPT